MLYRSCGRGFHIRAWPVEIKLTMDPYLPGECWYDPGRYICLLLSTSARWHYHPTCDGLTKQLLLQSVQWKFKQERSLTLHTETGENRKYIVCAIYLVINSLTWIHFETLVCIEVVINVSQWFYSAGCELIIYIWIVRMHHIKELAMTRIKIPMSLVLHHKIWWINCWNEI